MDHVPSKVRLPTTGRGMTVVVVHPDANRLQQLVAALSPLGTTLCASLSGEDACGCDRLAHADLVVLCESILVGSPPRPPWIPSDISPHRVVPLLAIVPEGDRDRRLTLLEAGVQDALEIPVQLPELRARARNLLELRSLQRAAIETGRRKAVSSLSRGLAHHFNNLLCGLSGSAQILCMKIPADSPLRRHAENIARNTQRAATIAQQLVSFSGARGEILPGVCQPEAALTAAWNALDASLDGAMRLMRIGDQVPRNRVVPLSPPDLQAVFYQILHNAVRSMGDKGILEIRSDLGPGMDTIRIAICDEGSGMDSRSLGQVFEPFWSGRGQPSDGGMGLPMVRALVEQGKGTIHIDSTPGQGTVVSLEFPLVEG